MIKSLRIYLLIVCILLALGLYFLRVPILTRVGAYPIVANELQASDVIAVMSGALPEIHYGIDLYKQGMGRKMLFVGNSPVELAVISKQPFEVVLKRWDEIANHYAVTAGVREADILTSEAFTNSTYERVKFALDMAKQHDLHSVIIISGVLHTRRIADSARRIDPSISVRVIPMPQEYYPEAYRFYPDKWWQNEADIKDVFGEYVKLAFYALGYQ